MKYIKWFFLAIIDLLFTAICYLTNPIVVLFATETGELPSIFCWWATWDDGLDVRWMVTEHKVPSWAQYDFDRHYKYYDEWQAEKIIGKHHGFVVPLDTHFSLWERVQRYVCRLCWLYRNTGYGFSYEVTGIDVRGTDVVKHNYEKRTGFYHLFYTSDNGFVLRYQKTWCKLFWLRVFIGWKMQDIDILQSKRCMLAFYVNPFKLR